MTGESDAAIRRIVADNRNGAPVGICSVCSAHPWVLEAALAEALETGAPALIESTSNQVNQYGGYTGKTPGEFAGELRSLARRLGFPPHQLLLGGDHLGPYPWRNLPAAEAMDNARALVRDCVAAGYVKVHLDASMPLGGDPPGAPAPEVAARRAAELCGAAEEAWRQSGLGPAPLYVIGTEVPVPGGEQMESAGPPVTRPEDANATVEAHRKAFAELGLASAFERVIGLVVQPGVEFGAEEIHAYDRGRARPLSARLPERPELVYEAHSTDYQTAQALREMVEDHFAILKVGPWLTFAMREAIFALSLLEQEWLARRSVSLSRVREALDEAMLSDPTHWKDYHKGEENDLRLARLYSYSDRVRYYWSVPAVQAEVSALIRNLTEHPPPPTLLSQFLPAQYEALRAGALPNDPVSLIQHRIRQVLRIYASAGAA